MPTRPGADAALGGRCCWGAAGWPGTRHFAFSLSETEFALGLWILDRFCSSFGDGARTQGPLAKRWFSHRQPGAQTAPKSGVAGFAAGAETVKAALQCDLKKKKPFPSCPETVYFLGILWDAGRCLFFKAFPVSKFIFGLGRVGRGGGCWGGGRWPQPSDLSFWLLVLDCWRWQLWDGRGDERGPGSVRGVGDTNTRLHRWVRANRTV